MMSTATLDRTEMQRFEALEKANQTRVRRGQLKREIRAGKVSVPDLLAAPPDWLLTAKVYDFLLCQPRWGRSKAAKAMACGQVAMIKTFGGLSERQRAELVRLSSSPVSKWRARPPKPRPKRPPWRRPCRGCGNPMKHTSDSGLCGFCERGI